LGEIERFVERAGFGLDQVAVRGHRFTSDADIFDALDFGHARTLVSFDSRAAQARIEDLPWIERASIERIFPDRLEVRVVERTPFAVWQVAGRTYLIDKTGRTLTAIPAEQMPALPRVAGEGAASECAALFARLSAYPDLLREVQLAERIGKRRWSLQLANASVVQLPAEQEAEALARADALGVRLTRASEFDLRIVERPIVRDRPKRVVERAANVALTANGG
jgi:cell division protein FtsQ